MKKHIYIIATLIRGENDIPGTNKFLSFLTFTYMKKRSIRKKGMQKKKKVCNNKITNSGRNLKMNKIKQKFWIFFKIKEIDQNSMHLVIKSCGSFLKKINFF